MIGTGLREARVFEELRAQGKRGERNGYTPPRFLTERFAEMSNEPDKAGKLKKWAAWFFDLLLVGCSAALPPTTNLAVLIALSAPTATMTAEFSSTKKSTKKKGGAK
ncbi:MAG TPA: hypothetical protein VIC84_22240 [Blastocatellia bacterium]